MIGIIASSLEDTLIDGLSFKPAKTASYIANRMSGTCHPQGSNIYTPQTGTKQLKLSINGSRWLDPSTCHVMFDKFNANGNMANRLRPIGGPWALLSRMRILAGGQIWEDIESYSRVHEMFNKLTAEGSRYNDYAEGFGHVWEGVTDPNALNGADNNDIAVSTVETHARQFYSSPYRVSSANEVVFRCVSCL